MRTKQLLTKANELSESSIMPSAEVSHLQGRFLATQCQLIDAQQVLEIGTLTAYSTLWLVSSSPTTLVTTIEVDPEAVISSACLAACGKYRYG